MIAKLGLTARQMREVQAYACVEPVGEGMVDYSGGQVRRQKPMDPEKRRALCRMMFGPGQKQEKPK